MNLLRRRIEYKITTRKLGRRTDIASDRQFFFIVSAGRSGSTLLRKHLMGNDQVGIPPESETLIPLIVKTWMSKLSYEVKVEKIVAEASKQEFMSFWEIDWDKLKEDLLSLSVTERILGEVIYKFYEAGTEDRNYLGDKTPYLVYYLNWLMNIFPNGKFIYLIRDGRAVVNSYYQSRGYSIEQACNRWNASITSFTRSRVYKKGRYLLLKYQDFVTEPEKTIKEVCSYLDVPFEESMLAPEIKDFGDGHLSHHKNVFNDINMGSIEKWRTDLSKEQIQQIEGRIKKNLMNFLYS